MTAGHVFIVGYGNPLRGDDGVGQEVAAALRGDGSPSLAAAKIVQAHQLAPEMAFDISRSSLAVFLDAAHDGAPAGSVAWRWLPVPPGPEWGRSGVGAGCWEDTAPGQLLALARDLYGAAPAGALVTVSVASLEAGMGLSPAVQAAVPRAAAAALLAIASAGRSRPRLAAGAVMSGPGRPAHA
jgi:hydrogenase maturation protease